jgi:hypothetical protein
MLRVLLIIGLILAAPLQSMGIGDVLASTGTTPAAEISVAQMASAETGAVLQDGQKHCCEDAKLADTRSGPCKSDCKAVMGSMKTASSKPVFEHGGAYLALDTSFHAPVDLRPPIS